MRLHLRAWLHREGKPWLWGNDARTHTQRVTLITHTLFECDLWENTSYILMQTTFWNEITLDFCNGETGIVGYIVGS